MPIASDLMAWDTSFLFALPPLTVPMMTSILRQPATAVLDTNVVLDWLVFGNPVCAPLVEALEQGRLRWISTEAMRGELVHVLGRGGLDAWEPDREMILRTWDRLSQIMPSPLSGLVPRLRCTDPDDQKFIELALGHAQWLISRDRAVLKLSSRATKLGLRILTPERWIDLASTVR